MSKEDPTGELPVASWLDYLLAAHQQDGRDVAARTLELLLAHVYRLARKDLIAQLPPTYRELLDSEELAEPRPIRKH